MFYKMKDLRITQLIKTYKKKYEDNTKTYIVNTVDISLTIIVPNTLLFNHHIDNNLKSLNKKKQISKTTESYYGNGILGNLFNVYNCDYNWVLSFVIVNQYKKLFTNHVKGFHIGFGGGGIISGLNHFLPNVSGISDYQWLGIDKNTENDFALQNQEHSINGFVCNNLLLDSNLKQVQLIINNKFNTINLLTNNVNPSKKNNKILISLAILAIRTLSIDGLMISRITEPDYWCQYMYHYLLLFGMLFQNTEIIRYPICKNRKIKYRYYLVCYNKKQILHNSIIFRKLINILKNNTITRLEFLNDIISMDEIRNWYVKINEIKDFYTNSLDIPQLELNNIISNITNYLKDSNQVLEHSSDES